MNRSKFYQWKARYGKENEHNGKIPRDFWVTEQEKQAVINYYQNPVKGREGYRAVTYMMIDEDVAYMSSSSVYRILVEANVMRTKKRPESKKGTGFKQPLKAHEHWHTSRLGSVSTSLLVFYTATAGVFYIGRSEKK